MAASDVHRVPVPRALNWCSVAFLVTVGLLCIVVVLAVPARMIRDQDPLPYVTGWLMLIGIGLFPVLHWIGVYRRSIVATLLVISLHVAFVWMLIAIVRAGLAEDLPAIADHLFFMLVIAFELFLIGLLLLWAWRLNGVRTGRLAPPPIVTPERDAYVPEYVPVGKCGWVIERSGVRRELRKTDEAIGRRARWFLPVWIVLRWPLYIMTWAGLAVACLGVPAMTIGVVAAVAGGADGPVFWTLTAVVLAALIALFSLMVWMFVSKLRKTILDVETLIQLPLVALGIVTAIAVVPVIAGRDFDSLPQNGTPAEPRMDTDDGDETAAMLRAAGGTSTSDERRWA